MARHLEEDALPELPPLLDDGEPLGDDAFALEVELSEEGSWADATELSEDEELFARSNEEEDETSWLDDSAAELEDALDDEDTDGPESGFLDDAPLGIDELGIELEDEAAGAVDTGEEGTDDPLVPASDNDDATDLPAFDESEEEGEGPDEEALDDDDDFDDVIEEPVPRTHRGA